MRRIALLQSEDIRMVVEKYFMNSPWVISLLAPSEKADEIRSLDFQSIVEKERPFGTPFEKREKPLIFRTVLDNRIRLIVKENRSNPIVTLQASFLGGVRYEKESQNGISQFIAVMVTKGTERQNSLEISKKVERMAGSLNGF